MSYADTSEGARELVDLTADAVEGMGQHLSQIGDIIALSCMPPKRGERGTARKCRDKFEVFKGFCLDIERRRKEAEIKLEEDFVRLREWRRETGTEGASMVEEMEMLFDKVRSQNRIIESGKQKEGNERAKVRALLVLGEKRERRQSSLAEAFIRKIQGSKAETVKRALVSSWLQCSFQGVRFRLKAAQETQRLKIEHLRKLRKARAQARLDGAQRSRERRLLQACLMAVQEECVERRRERHLQEVRKRHEDHVLVLEAQIAQALGDEEKAKDLINEQVRRLEAAKQQAREAEQRMKAAQREAREARADADQARLEAEDARREQAAAEAQADAARDDARAARAEAGEANDRANSCDAARVKAELGQRKAEDEVRKKAKKISSLQRMLAELGAESDSDAPPDERPPAFFVNEDGTKIPRPRTRKERMGMAYREAESARWELRLGMAAMIDKDIANASHVDRLRYELDISQREVVEVRRANEMLVAEADAAAAAAISDAATQTFLEPVEVQAPLPEPPLAPTRPATSPFSPMCPAFSPAPLLDVSSTSPRLLLKTASQPILMPPLHAGPPNDGLQVPEKLTLAPLRKLKRPTNDWRIGWH